ncbi:MAG: hypothetical protein GAK43_02743 [Stenotrophomonas maltophilia]|nr:MAG: hypothetical protein GAK43_02743 [Stenotrophomonas maltophilia]
MSTSPELQPHAGHLPGDLAMWFFILAELTVFAILIIAFGVTQRLETPEFLAGRAQLDLSMGLALTLTLLTAGGWRRWRWNRYARTISGVPGCCWRVQCCWGWCT